MKKDNDIKETKKSEEAISSYLYTFVKVIQHHTILDMLSYLKNECDYNEEKIKDFFNKCSTVLELLNDKESYKNLLDYKFTDMEKILRKSLANSLDNELLEINPDLYVSIH